MKLKIVSISGALLAGCAATSITYSHDTDLPVVMVDGERYERTRFVSREKAPILPVKYGKWLIPSGAL